MHLLCVCRPAEEEPLSEVDRVEKWEHDLFVLEQQAPRTQEEKQRVREREAAKYSFICNETATHVDPLHLGAYLYVAYPNPKDTFLIHYYIK